MELITYRHKKTGYRVSRLPVWDYFRNFDEGSTPASIPIILVETGSDWEEITVKEPFAIGTIVHRKDNVGGEWYKIAKDRYVELHTIKEDCPYTEIIKP